MEYLDRAAVGKVPPSFLGPTPPECLELSGADGRRICSAEVNLWMSVSMEHHARHVSADSSCLKS